MFIKQYLTYKIIRYIVRIFIFILFTLILLFLIGWGISSYQPEQVNNFSTLILELIPDFIFEQAENFYKGIKNLIIGTFS